MALVLTLVARPLAVWLCLGPFGFTLHEKLFVSWVGLRGAVSIFLAAIPKLAGLPNAAAYFNIAFFVVLVSLLVQGSTLTAAARRLGVALRQATPASSRVEIDIPGQTEQEIVGYPVTAESIILGLSAACRPGRGSSWWSARARSSSRRGRARCGPATTAISWSRASGCRGSTACSAPARDVARRLGLLFGELPIRGETRVGRARRSSTTSTSAAHAADETLADWMAARLDGRPALDAARRDPRAALLVRRLEAGRIASVGLQLEELMQVEPDERLLARLEENADELAGLRRWIAGLVGRA